MIEDLHRVSMFLETIGSYDTVYDIDDLFFRYSYMEGDIRGLVVDGRVKGKWGIGSC